MSIWDKPQALELLQQCLAKRMTAGETAAFLSRRLEVIVTRNMICGKAWRLGHRVRGGTSDDEMRRKASIRVKQEHAERTRMIRARLLAEREAAARAALEVLIEPKPCGDGESGCRFPSWGHEERTTRLFCGAPRGPLESYCRFHARVCFNRVSEAQANKIIAAAA